MVVVIIIVIVIIVIVIAIICIVIITTKRESKSKKFVSKMQMTAGVKVEARRVEAVDRFPPNLVLGMKVEMEV